MRKIMTTAALAALLLASAAPVSMLAAQSTAQSAPLSPQEQAAMDQLAREVQQLKPQSGKISIPEGKLELDLGQKYVFYSAADARKILVDIWGNPPEAVEGTLGMVMPAGSTPLSDAWGAIISFEDSGYVSDEDAADTEHREVVSDHQQEGEPERSCRPDRPPLRGLHPHADTGSGARLRGIGPTGRRSAEVVSRGHERRAPGGTPRASRAPGCARRDLLTPTPATPTLPARLRSDRRR